MKDQLNKRSLYVGNVKKNYYSRIILFLCVSKWVPYHNTNLLLKVNINQRNINTKIMNQLQIEIPNFLREKPNIEKITGL